jgi:hypothetical protein
MTGVTKKGVTSLGRRIGTRPARDFVMYPFVLFWMNVTIYGVGLGK